MALTNIEKTKPLTLNIIIVRSSKISKRVIMECPNLKCTVLPSVGCGQLYVADGNWKLRYAHCMWKVPVMLTSFGKINYPSICPLSPKRGQAFCQSHCEKAHAPWLWHRAAGFLEEMWSVWQTC